MEITITSSFRVLHPCQMLRRPLETLKTIPHPHGHLLPMKPLITLLNLVSCRVTYTHLSMLTPKPPQTLIVLMRICFLPTMDHVRWFHPMRLYFCPLFASLPCNIIKKPSSWLSSYTSLPHKAVLHKHFILPNLALNI
jgi:hypothetical protein